MIGYSFITSSSEKAIDVGVLDACVSETRLLFFFRACVCVGGCVCVCVCVCTVCVG
jgi:hypothetical protein